MPVYTGWPCNAPWHADDVLVIFYPVPVLVDIIPFVAFPIVVFAVRAGHFFHRSLVSHLCLAVLERETEGKAGLDDRPAVPVRIPDAPFLIHDAVHAILHVVVAVVVLDTLYCFMEPQPHSNIAAIIVGILLIV